MKRKIIRDVTPEKEETEDIMQIIINDDLSALVSGEMWTEVREEPGKMIITLHL
jgi:hypothetical protein